MESIRPSAVTPNEICKICRRAKASYTCPRCQTPYCSLSCYRDQKHEKCSEKFYEESVLEELQNQSASEEEKQAMLGLLKQFEEDCADDEQNMMVEEKAAELAARLSGIDLDGDPQKIWEKLTKEEREEFTKLVKEQNFSDIVQEWLPWWTYKKDKKPLVVDVEDKPEAQVDLSHYNFPEINTKLQPFSNLSKADPALCLKYNIINILLSYIYVTMRYNGEHQSMPVQCAEDLVSLSVVLLKAENCQSCDEAVRNVYSSLKKLDDLFVSLEYFGASIDALVDVIQGPEHLPSIDYLLMAVSDILLLLDNSKKALKKEPESADGRKKLVLMRKKVEFYSSWLLSYGLIELPGLIVPILDVRDKLLEERESHEKTEKLKRKAEENRKPKIEVLSG